MQMNPELEQLAEKYGVMIKTPPIEAKDTSDFFLIRHGFSEFNYRHLVLKKDVG